MTLANWITITRLILAPLVYWQLAQKNSTGLLWALIGLTLAGLSDVLDGWVARSRNEVSESGKLLDPIADKTLILMTLFALTKWSLPTWIFWLYLLKETIQIVGGAILLRRYKLVIAANRWGKAGTFCFFLGFGLFIINRIAGLVLLALALGVSTYALYSYYRLGRLERLKDN